ncbi:MAG: 3-phosphoshikimate 1-carboxyvinyltransferase [Balneolaceae bacterium]|nr:MAG: 3-phosphoshikimate 1-carboxyvinyltransferase [Balneolaceae bacterium]
MIQEVLPVSRFSGTVTVPPDKSISHRAALFAALSEEESTIENYSDAADPQSTLACLRQLGVSATQAGDRVVIRGVGRDGFTIPEQPLDCGNSGTTMRLLGGIVAGAGVSCTLTGDESLSARTMKRIMDPLLEMGCRIRGREGRFAPLTVDRHKGVKEISFPLPIASAQLKSAVLLAGLFGEKPTEVVEKVQSRDHTERLLGLRCEPSPAGTVIRSSREDVIPAQNYRIPGDFSAASFWLAAGSILAGSELTLRNVGMNPTRTAALQILEEMGADFRVINQRSEGREPVADIEVRSAKLRAVKPDPSLVPNCIDELPILMVAMCFAGGSSVISGAEELRHKETDRLSAMEEILRRAGASVEAKPDGLVIHGRTDFRPLGAEYPTWHDHRMAMSAAILASASDKPSLIQGAECTAISYPAFWDHLTFLSQ